MAQDNVGVFDVDTMTFTTVPTTGDAASGHGKYDGAVVVGSKAGTPRSAHPQPH